MLLRDAHTPMYMTMLAMQKLKILDVGTVAKAGDTAREIEEGLNCGCGLAIGVLTGAGQSGGLRDAGADLVLPDVCEFEKLFFQHSHEYRFVASTSGNRSCSSRRLPQLILAKISILININITPC
ncbi:unnamed protein product [Amoebophrya sp. A25]|nr:unnamed protein product [Amoebophrya sp. A25]|eukprot:GSA25T00007714001.1